MLNKNKELNNMKYKIIKKTDNLREAVETANEILKANSELELFNGYSNDLDFKVRVFNECGILALVTEDGKVLQVTDGQYGELYMSQLTCGTVLTGGTKHLSTAHHKDGIVTIQDYPEVALTNEVRKQVFKNREIIFTA